jgi:hypothetical protein
MVLKKREGELKDTRDQLKETAMYKRESVHLFCAGRIQDHQAKDLIDNGYTTLEKTKLADLLRTSTERAEVLAMIRQHRQHGSVPESHT